jgi:hypothetical protein
LKCCIKYLLEEDTVYSKRQRTAGGEAGGLTLVSILIEVKCPQHGFERFRVKVITRFNIASNKIMVKERSRPRKGEISRLYIGRNVSYKEAKDYLINHFRERGMLEKIVRMKISV